MAQELEPQKPQATLPSVKPASTFSLPSAVAKLVEDNGPMMFPETGPSYRAGWSPPKTIPSELADRLPGLLQATEKALVPAPAEAALLLLNKLALHYWQADRPASHFKSLITDYLIDLAHVPPDILAEGIKQYRRTAVWFPKVAELLAILNPMVEQRRREADRLRKLIAAAGKDKPAEEERPRLKPWAERTPEERERHEKIMAEFYGGPRPIGDVLPKAGEANG